MTKIIKNALLPIIALCCLSLQNNVYSQLCEEAVLPPAVIDGLTVTSTWTGSVTTYALAFTSCVYTTPINSLHLGLSGVFTYTYTFSEPVNNVVFFITATGQDADEVFTIDTDAGIPNIIDLGSCFTTVAGNVISSGALAGPEGGGGAFEVNSPFGGYTSFTISGPGGSSGSLFALCVNSIAPVPSIFTTTDVTCFGACDGTATVVDSIGVDTPYTYLWDAGAGGGVDVSATDLCPGTYSVEVTGASGEMTIYEVTIEEPEELIGSIVSQTNISCYGDEDGIVDVGAIGGTGDYLFDIGAGSVPTSEFTGLAAGLYTVTITDENDCEETIDVELTEPEEILVSETVVDEMCPGDCTGSIDLEVLVGEAPFSYSIDACATTSPGGLFTDLCSGDYTVCVADVNGCEYSTSVTVIEGVIAVDVALNPIGPFCLTDDAVTITGVDLGIITGAGVVGGTFNPSTAGVGTHTITNTVVIGCGGVGTIDVIVMPLPSVSFLSDENTGCQPVQVEFNATGTPGISCLWDFGDGTFSTSCGTAVHTYDNAGDYDVTLTITDANGCTNSTTYYEYVNVYAIPDADFSFMPNTVTTLNPEVKFTDLSSEETSWIWNFSNLAGSNVENPTFIFPYVDGSYPVTLIVESEFGCRDTIIKIVRVTQEQLIFVPNIIMPDGDTFNEVFKPYFNGIDVYNYHLTIHNRWGEVIFESYDLSKGWNGTYGGEIVTDGMYIWHIVTSEITTDKKLEYHGHVTVLR